MKKALALILACCLISGCTANPEPFDSGESYISSSVSSENSSEPESVPASSGDTSDTSKPQSSAPASSAPASEPQNSAPASSAPASKPQSSAPASSAPASEPQSSAPASSAPASEPQSGAPASTTPASEPQSSAPASSAPASEPQSSIPASSTPASEPAAEVIGPYGQRAPEQWETEYANEVFRLTNIERVKNGLPEFKRLPLLDEVAGIRAWELIPLYDHNRPDGRSCFTAFEEAGISYSAAAENIAAGYRTPEEVVNGWMNSPRHRANILNPDLDYLGVGFYCDSEGIGSTNYRYYWAQNFCSTW